MAGHNPLYKLGSLYRNIVCAFGTVFRPHQHLSLDEGMVPWRGNLSFRVYNPDKPKKYGIKAYMLSDAVTGYCSRFKLYTGKSDTPASANGATYDLVMDMMRGYFGQGYILYMDNYYSSPKLYTDLFVLGCGATGTLRVNRKGIPQRIKDKKVDKGDMFSMCNDELVLVKYHDRKVVYLLSTIEEAAKAPNGRVAPRTGTPIENPAIVNAYNKYMGGVDRSDQMVSYATFNARTLKWWKRVIFHVISLATLNAYLCYKFVTPRKPMLHRVFRKQLVTELLQSVSRACVPGMCTKPVGRPSTAAEPIMRLQGQHFPIKIVGTGKKRNISRACVVCSVAERQRLEAIGEKRKRTGKESSYQCDKCLTALCVEPCFKLFHTHKDYIAAYKTRVMIDE
ncbi:piggyBac transposable element-derived protein 4-like [Saccostrea echinata]|uniref:piggyBac transposable element-derived protein 4-like n=1 Tax=Saccostrea echinata TaxID=191078 RepID=UPI002A83BBAD|nr:piggyBac transposable element-derived protein 4-like [Saccostrea echinata]